MRVLTQGTRLADRYTLIRRLGAGGMSEVWLARDDRSEQRVALKFLTASLAQTEGYRKLFHQEWRAASRLMHAHIVRVFEYHDEPDGPFYSQQYVEGPDIRVVADLPPLDALRPFGLIADALRYAHGKGFVHRDIKASNVLLDSRGLPCLIDFGVAAPTGATSTGGSAISAAPRQEAGDKAAVPADDVYALGVLMHEVLTGNPPRTAGNEQDEAAIEKLPVALQQLLRDMLAPEASARPSAEQVLDRLRDAGAAPGPAARPSTDVHDSSAESYVPETDISVATIRKLRPAALPGAEASAGPAHRGVSSGVSPTVAFGGLAVLLLAFLSVVFLLPSSVERDTGPGDEPPPVADSDDAASPADDGQSDEAAPVDAATEARQKAATDESLGRFLARLDRLTSRGIEHWGGQAYQDMLEVYQQGDQAYLAKDYPLAGERYDRASGMLEPFFDRVDEVFDATMRAAREAFASGDHAEAVRLFDLAVTITPANAAAQEGLARARNLSSVLDLTDQALRFEQDLELQAAKLAFEKALNLDPAWQPAADGLARVTEAIRQFAFERHMTEGLDALAAGNYQTARAAFNAAKDLKPESQQPTDGLLQVDQEVRLANIRRLEQEAAVLENNEEWRAAIAKYEEIMEIDEDLEFVREGLRRSRERAALHDRLDQFIRDPDSLSAPATMQSATQLLLQVTPITPMGPRLEDRKNELARLLKRAATPLKVQLVSDNATEVSIFRVGKLGTFATQEVSLRPGAYVATGSRAGFRDVRLEFRVGPEIELEPIVIMCEEQI